MQRARDGGGGEDSVAAYDIEMDANSQAFVGVRKFHHVFEGRSIHLDVSTGEDALFERLNDPGVDPRRETKIIGIHDEQFFHPMTPLYPGVIFDTVGCSGYAGSRKIMPSSSST